MYILYRLITYLDVFTLSLSYRLRNPILSDFHSIFGVQPRLNAHKRASVDEALLTL